MNRDIVFYEKDMEIYDIVNILEPDTRFIVIYNLGKDYVDYLQKDFEYKTGYSLETEMSQDQVARIDENKIYYPNANAFRVYNDCFADNTVTKLTYCQTNGALVIEVD